MAWDIEFTDQFGEWWDALDEDTQVAIDAIVRVLEKVGPALTRPYADTVKGSRHPNMRELRVQHQGRPLRLLYAFDPRRTAIVLVGGDKGGDGRWYDVHIPIADRLYDEHLEEIASQQNSKEVQ
ncbi:MAG: type II toxin-antitoxin system RelE/ParE family toxin [Vulcanimicrobiaceae bacterium]